MSEPMLTALLRIFKTQRPPVSIIHVCHEEGTYMHILLSRSQCRVGSAADLHAGVSRRQLLSLPGIPGLSILLVNGTPPAAPALFSSRSCSWLGRPLRGALCRQPGLLLHSPPLCRTTAAQPAQLLFSTAHAYRLETFVLLP